MTFAQLEQQHIDGCDLCAAAVAAGPGMPAPGNCEIAVKGAIPCPHPGLPELLGGHRICDHHWAAFADLILAALAKNG